MKTLKFILRGKTAFFKNPEVNTYFYFSYGNVHKPALLGMFGAIMGYKGYEAGSTDYPDYYKVFKDIKVSIIPETKHGYFTKKIQYFNNSVGYASQEQGGNLIIKEQWLENPKWTVYVPILTEPEKELSDMLLEKKCIYMPYLGKNDHPAIIENVTVEDLQKTQDIQKINCLFPASIVTFDWDEATFKYEEFLPIALRSSTHQYEMQKFRCTDALVEGVDTVVYKDGERNIVFY